MEKTSDQAISLNNDELEISALDSFCELLKKEPDLSVHATRILAARIQSQVVKESLLSLDALEGKFLKLCTSIDDDSQQLIRL